MLRPLFSKEHSEGVWHCPHLWYHWKTNQSVAPGLCQAGKESPEAARWPGKRSFPNSNDGVLKKKKKRLKGKLWKLFLLHKKYWEVGRMVQAKCILLFSFIMVRNRLLWREGLPPGSCVCQPSEGEMWARQGAQERAGDGETGFPCPFWYLWEVLDLPLSTEELTFHSFQRDRNQ